ncbi:MAG: cell division protein ZapB [Spirochaetaceae bacterium]|nr:MAG: cell division protein ZapB [Spirochaetaceae bacterium]
MITLEQIHRLEKGVQNAVAAITAVKGENTLLKQKLSGYEKRITELEAKLVEFKESQSEIERGLLAALDQLDTLEDEVLEEVSPPAEQDHGEFSAAEPHQPAPEQTTDSAAPDSDDNSTGASVNNQDEQQSADELDIF